MKVKKGKLTSDVLRLDGRQMKILIPKRLTTKLKEWLIEGEKKKRNEE